MLKKIFYPAVFMAVALLMLALLMVPRALASPSTVTFTVNSTLDQPDDLTIPGICHTATGICTLRAAVMQANRTSGIGVTIILPSGLYTLTIPAAGVDGEENGDLNLTTPASGSPVITIIGAGAANTIIDANQIDGVMRIAANRTASISGVTIRNGNRGASIYNGGGIHNQGALTIIDCVIEGNQADLGGGIATENSATLDVIRCTIRSNVGVAGGGIYVAGPTTVRDSTFHSNGARWGGGIFNGNTLYVVNSTFSQNNADDDGGGIYSRSTTALYNTSVIGNDADHDRDEKGGIGGGVRSVTEPGTRFIVVNSLIAGNTILDAPIDDDCNGTLEVYGLNLFGEVTGCTFSGNGTASRGFISLNTIGPLQDNGGPTWTQALLADSVAIDTTFDSLGCVDETGALLTTDQRGAPRPVGARCDVGAFEYSPPRYLYLPLILR